MDSFEFDDDDLMNTNAISATECTGLMPTPPQSEEELESYKSLYSMEIDVDAVDEIRHSQTESNKS